MSYINFINEYINAPYGQKTKVIEKWSVALDKGKDTLYKKLKEVAPEEVQSRKKRSDSSMRRRYTQEEIDLIAQIKSKDPDGRLTTASAVKIGVKLGKLDPEKFYNTRGEVKSTVDHILRDKGYNQNQPSKSIEYHYVNEVHSLDFSGSEYFTPIRPIENESSENQKLFWHGNDWLLKSKKMSVQKNKTQIRNKLWYFGIKDAFSGKTHFLCDVMAGESAVSGIHGLMHTWGVTGEVDAPLAIPDYLRGDNGSFYKSRFTKSLVAGIPDLDWVHITPGNSKSNGSIETEWRSLWRWESEVAAEMRILANKYPDKKEGMYIKLSELRERLEGFLIRELNNRPHLDTRNFPGMSRAAVYLQGLQGKEARRLPENVMAHIHMTEERTLDAEGRFSYQNISYQGPRALQNKRVLVNCGLDGEVILEYRGKQYLAEELKKQQFGTFGAEKDTYREQMRKVKVSGSLDVEDRSGAKIRHVHFGKNRDVEIASPHTALKQQDYYADEQEALLDLGRWLDDPITNYPEDVQADVREIIRDVRREEDGYLKSEIRGRVDMYMDSLRRQVAGRAS